MKINISEHHIRVLFVTLLVLIFGGIYFVIPDFYKTVWRMSLDGDMGGTIAYLKSFGLWAVAISMVIDITINIVGFLPSIFISTANGIIFGILPGILISWAAETIGVVISFFLMRSLFRNSAKKIIEKSHMLSKLDEYSNITTMIIARAVPYSPNGLVTALGALSHISYRDYTIACAIGKLPSVAIEVLVGYDVINYQENMWRLTLVIMAVVLVYGGLWWWHRRNSK